MDDAAQLVGDKGSGAAAVMGDRIPGLGSSTVLARPLLPDPHDGPTKRARKPRLRLDHVTRHSTGGDSVEIPSAPSESSRGELLWVKPKVKILE